jgi:hypothetical protein
MAKLSITRFFEISRFLATEAGKQLSDFLIFASDFFEQVLRALRNGLTFADNMNCTVLNVTLQHEVPQVINSGGKTPFLILNRTISTSTTITGLVSYMDNNNQLVVVPTFKSAPSGDISVVLVLIFS